MRLGIQKTPGPQQRCSLTRFFLDFFAVCGAAALVIIICQAVCSQKIKSKRYLRYRSINQFASVSASATDKMERGHFFQEFIAGNIGGLCGITLVYPLDTAKIRMQVYPQYRSTMDVIRSMAQKDGFKSLYRGISFPAMGFGLTFAISFRYICPIVLASHYIFAI